MLKQFPAKQKNQKTMKKVFLTLALVLTTVVASAQWYVGGGLGFSKTEDAAKNKTTAFNLKPEVGYKFNDKWAVGGNILIDWTKDVQTQYGIAPYVRYTVLTAGEFSIYADGVAEFSIVKPEEGDNGSLWGIGVRPGVSYNIDENWTVAAHVGFLGYYDAKDCVIKNLNNSESFFGFNLANNLSLSLYYNF